MAAPSKDIPGSSDRSFGLTFAAVFTILAFLPVLFGSAGRPVAWLLVLAVLFLALALTMGRILRPLNRLWFKFGGLLNGIVSPLIITLLYAVAFVPIGTLMRLSGKDPLSVKSRRGAASHWIPREPPGPDGESLKEQF